jgi:hypothetical protein
MRLVGIDPVGLHKSYSASAAAFGRGGAVPGGSLARRTACCGWPRRSRRRFRQSGPFAREKGGDSPGDIKGVLCTYSGEVIFSGFLSRPQAAAISLTAEPRINFGLPGHPIGADPGRPPSRHQRSDSATDTALMRQFIWRCQLRTTILP